MTYPNDVFAHGHRIEGKRSNPALRKRTGLSPGFKSGKKR
jgi:hypothetical protein